MNVLNTSSLQTALIRRELGCLRDCGLQKIVANQTIQNLASNKFTPNKIDMLTKNQLNSFHRSGDFFVINQKDTVSLWNISLGLKVWSVRKKHFLSNVVSQKILVDKQGYVAKIYLENNIEQIFTVKVLIKIFFNGEEIGSFSENNLFNFRLINGHIFALGTNLNKLYFYEWDENGSQVKKLLLPDFNKNPSGFLMVVNQDYFVISCYSKIFILNLRTQSYNIFDLKIIPTFERNLFGTLEIKSICLHEDHLIIGSINSIPSCDTYSMKYFNARISFFNVTTGIVEKDYRIEKKSTKIISIIANSERALYIALDPPKKIYLCYYDFLTNTQKEIMEIPNLNDLFKFEDVFQFFRSGNLVTFCYAFFDVVAKAVVNTNGEIISMFRYLDAGSFISYESGIVAIFNKDTQKLYIEDFKPFFSGKNGEDEI